MELHVPWGIFCTCAIGMYLKVIPRRQVARLEKRDT